MLPPAIVFMSTTDSKCLLPLVLAHGRMNVYDMHGKFIVAKTVSRNGNADVSSLASGIYVYTVETEKGLKSGKIIKR